MIGRDFTSIKSFLTEEAVDCLEKRGADTLIVHNSLSKMYFEAIWNLKEIKQKIDMDAEQFGIMKEEGFLNSYYQMLFDVITFYNMGNANQFYSYMHSHWTYSEIFSSCHNHNNKFLSVVMYLNYFIDSLRKEQRDNEELFHLLFLNAVMLVKYNFRKEEFNSFLKTISKKHELIEQFYSYAEHTFEGFFREQYLSGKSFSEFIKSEVDYFLTLEQNKMDNYFCYGKHAGAIIRECESCADRQNNYGLIETEFEDIFDVVI